MTVFFCHLPHPRMSGLSCLTLEEVAVALIPASHRIFFRCVPLQCSSTCRPQPPVCRTSCRVSSCPSSGPCVLKHPHLARSCNHVVLDSSPLWFHIRRGFAIMLPASAHETSSAFIIKTHRLELTASPDLFSRVLVSLPMVSPGARFCCACASSSCVFFPWLFPTTCRLPHHCIVSYVQLVVPRLGEVIFVNPQSL